MLTSKQLEAIAQKKGVGHLKKHFFICTGPKCCSSEEGQEVWDFVKKTLKEKGLAPESVFRSKVGCLRICSDGPIGLVYPEGTWYQKLNKENCLRVIEEHLENNLPVNELIFAKDSLEPCREN